MALIWVLGGTEMLFWNFDRGDLSPGWRWVEIIETWLDINVSHLSRSRLTFMPVLKTASLVHPGPIWNPSRYHYVCLTSIHDLPHLHPCPPSMHRFTSIHVPKFFMLQPGHDVGISHPSISCLTSIQVKRIAPQLHSSSTTTYPGLKMCVSTQSRPHRTAKTQYLHSISTQD